MLKMTAILPGARALAFDKTVRKAWARALKAEAGEIKKLYDKTTRTWKHAVAFKQRIKFSADEQFAEVWAENRIYWFVHESVSVMRAVLSPDWSPKTQPRVLSSGAGSGRKLYASKRVSKPPYEARKFTEAIIEERQDKFQQAMEKATEEGVKRGAP